MSLSGTHGDGILRACGRERWEAGKAGILRLAYCPIYCLFSGPIRGYSMDSIDWIDRFLEV